MVFHAACNEMTSPKKNAKGVSVMLTEFTAEIAASYLEYCETMQAFPYYIHKGTGDEKCFGADLSAERKEKYKVATDTVREATCTANNGDI